MNKFGKDQPSGHIRGPSDFVERFSGAVDVSRETVQRLEVYEGLLRKWQPIKNLVANATLDDIWHRHFADSAQLATHVDPHAHWIDIGAGAGFPGLVLAILRGNSHRPPIMLIEANSRKCAFLREVARNTDIVVDIHNARVEDVRKSQHLHDSSIVTARAVAPLVKLIEYAEPFFVSASTSRPSGPKAIFLKGRDAASEIAEAKARWPDLEMSTRPSITSEDGHLVFIE